MKKSFTVANSERLGLLIVILTRYINLNRLSQSIRFLKRVVGILSNVKDNEQRAKINDLIVSNYR